MSKKKTTVNDITNIKNKLQELLNGATWMLLFLKKNKEFNSLEEIINYMEKYNEK
tara:strand:+ start:134 stop:298 length:165 start_codon:yes stop_codon:yes gene_type:complete